MGRSASASLRFELLTTYDLLESADSDAAAPEPPQNWLLLDTTTYVLLPASRALSVRELREQLSGFAERHVPADQLAFAGLRFDLVPVTQLLTRAGNAGVFASRTGLTVTSAFLLLGGLVLVVACINYANLAAARAADRGRDIGVRKLVGAKARHVTASCLMEAGMLTVAALPIAFAIVALAVPVIGATLGMDLRVTALFDRPAALLRCVALLLAVTLTAAVYPAFVLARLPPVSTLSCGRARARAGGFWAVLLAAQFAAASFLSIAAVVTYQQNAALREIALARGKSPVVVIENPYAATRLLPDTLENELLGLPYVAATSSMASAPWAGLNVLPLSRSEADEATPRSALWEIVGYDFFETFGIRIVAGRVFDRNRGEDALRFFYAADQPNSIVINRSLVDELGFGSPELALEQVIYVPRRLLAGFGSSAAQPLRIIGIVEDKPLDLVGVGPRSSVYSFAEPLPYQAVRIAREDIAAALAQIDSVWRKLLPNVALHRRLADDIFAERYRNFERIQRSFSVIAGVALIIAASGLFAMAAVLTQRRSHEIAVRKVLGASRMRITAMLLGAFVKPVLTGAVIAWPAAYLAARAYLGAFVEPIELTPMPFLLCLVGTLTVVVATVCGQASRAAAARPETALRDL
jgi:putative ABC transport system permease protein